MKVGTGTGSPDQERVPRHSARGAVRPEICCAGQPVFATNARCRTYRRLQGEPGRARASHHKASASAVRSAARSGAGYDFKRKPLTGGARSSVEAGGDGGIRTLDRALQPYNGLANRRLQPLGHVSGPVGMPDVARSRKRQIAGDLKSSQAGGGAKRRSWASFRRLARKEGRDSDLRRQLGESKAVPAIRAYIEKGCRIWRRHHWLCCVLATAPRGAGQGATTVPYPSKYHCVLFATAGENCPQWLHGPCSPGCGESGFDDHCPGDGGSPPLSRLCRAPECLALGRRVRKREATERRERAGTRADQKRSLPLTDKPGGFTS